MTCRYPHLWQDSLEHNGVVCTHAISIEKIVDHRVIPRDQAMLLFALGMDSLPTVDNFGMFGALYQDCMAALFAEEDVSTLKERVRQIYLVHGEEPWGEDESQR